MITGAKLIAEERQRQIDIECWSEEHDDKHDDETLICAANSYLFAGSEDDKMPFNWPWSEEWWKPSDNVIINLTKAGALIAAEIDRILRERSKPHDF